MGELLARISSRELAEWQAYEQVAGPFGDARADYRAALVAMVTANAFRGKDSPPLHLEDFLLQFGGEPPQPVSAETSLAYFEMLTGGMG